MVFDRKTIDFHMILIKNVWKLNELYKQEIELSMTGPGRKCLLGGCVEHVSQGMWQVLGNKSPQKLSDSHCCVPITATFSKRRKIGAL